MLRFPMIRRLLMFYLAVALCPSGLSRHAWCMSRICMSGMNCVSLSVPGCSNVYVQRRGCVRICMRVYAQDTQVTQPIKSQATHPADQKIQTKTPDWSASVKNGTPREHTLFIFPWPLIFYSTGPRDVLDPFSSFGIVHVFGVSLAGTCNHPRGSVVNKLCAGRLSRGCLVVVSVSHWLTKPF